MSAFNQMTGKYREIDNAFAKELLASLRKNQAEHWAEKQDAYASGIMLDFDFLQTHGKQQVTDSMKEKLGAALAKFIIQQIKFGDVPENVENATDKDFMDEMYYAIIHRGHVEYKPKKKAFKDGLHFLMPEVMVSREVKRWLIHAINASGLIEETLKNCVFDDKEAVLDGNSAHVPVLFIGSCKRDKTTAYPVLNYYRIDPDGFDYCPYTFGKRDNPIVEFMLNNTGLEKVCNKKAYELNDTAQAAFEAYQIDKEAKRKKAEEEDAKFKPTEEEIEQVKESAYDFVELVKEAVSNLSPERARETKTWFRVLAVLKSMANMYDVDMFPIADEFSQLDETAYVSKDDVQRCYDAVKPFGYVSYFAYMLKQDSVKASKAFWSGFYKLCPPKSKYQYFEDYQKLLNRKDVPVCEVFEWIQNTISILVNGGNAMFLTKNKRFDRQSQLYGVKYQELSKFNLCSSMSMLVNIKQEEEKKDEEEEEKENKEEDNKEEETQEEVTKKKKVIKKKEVVADPVPKPKKGKPSEKEETLVKLGNLINTAHLTNRIPTYTCKEFYPYLHPEDYESHGMFNIFGGFPMQQYRPAAKPDVTTSRWYRHIKEQMHAGDAAVHNYWLKWLAHMIQKPYEVPGVALLYNSQQGNGKDTMGDFIEKLIGHQHALRFDDPMSFFNNFNKSQEQCLFIALNEVSDKGEAFNKHNQLKSFITRTQSNIEPKGVDSYKATAFARYMFFTNNENALRVENSDRRFCMIKCKNEFAQDKETFDAIYSELDSMDYIKAWFDYLADVDLTGFNVRSVPTTKYKQEQKLACLSSPLQWLIEAMTENVFVDSKDEDDIDQYNEGVLVSKELVVGAYDRWCDEEKLSTKFRLNTKRLTQELGYVGIEYKRVRIGSERKRGFIFSKEAILQGFQRYLKNPDFVFEEEEDMSQSNNE